MNRKKTAKKSYLVVWVALTVVLLLGIYFLINRAGLKDLALAAAYKPSERIAAVNEKLDLTEAGERIYRASWPELYEEDFNQYCSSYDKDAAVLGCYADGKIYIYNIENAELDGIREATAAHELLHAVWERLSGNEKEGLLAELNKIYADEYEKLKIIDTYAETAKASELYARVGTEVENLSEELSAHYAKYFENRGEIVGYHEKYAAKFSELDSALRTGLTEMEGLEKEISAGKKEYEEWGAVFEKAVVEFNNCADTVGCFDMASFSARRAELVAEQGQLNAKYAELSSKIERYNELVGQYNANLLARKKLNQMVNSKERKENL